MSEQKNRTCEDCIFYNAIDDNYFCSFLMKEIVSDREGNDAKLNNSEAIRIEMK